MFVFRPRSRKTQRLYYLKHGKVPVQVWENRVCHQWKNKKIFRAFCARKALRTLRLTQCPQNWLTMMAGSANFEDRENQIEAQRSGFDLERRSRGVSARWLLMQSIKKPSQAMRSLRRRWQCQPILRTGRTDRNRSSNSK